MQVYHSVYGQGTKISSEGSMTKVRFVDGSTLDVPSNELSQVLND